MKATAGNRPLTAQERDPPQAPPIRAAEDREGPLRSERTCQGLRDFRGARRGAFRARSMGGVRGMRALRSAVRPSETSPASLGTLPVGLSAVGSSLTVCLGTSSFGGRADIDRTLQRMASEVSC
jgi:hypothetical protein